jgi:transmembrane sensor
MLPIVDGENSDMNPVMTSAEVEAAAAAWFARRESGDWSAADQAQWEAWLDASTAHRIAFIRIVTAWERSGRLSALGAGVPSGIIPERDAWSFGSRSNAAPLPSVAQPPERHAMSSSRRALSAFAGLLIVGAGFAAVWYFSMYGTRSYRTSVGAVATFPLADGSKVTLNTDTHIDVELGKTQRRVKLGQGEAFFDVSKDAARPFVVEIADKRVIAVGTQFAVRRDDDEMRVLVTEGRVRIERRGVAADAAATQLPAGSEARTARIGILIDQPTPFEVEQRLSWRSGYVLFRDTALADAVADFNRYSVRKIFIQDPAIAGIRIGGHFRTDDADAFLWLLQSGFPIRVEQRSDRIILTKR